VYSPPKSLLFRLEEELDQAVIDINMGLKEIQRSLRLRPFLDKRAKLLDDNSGWELNTIAGDKIPLGRNEPIEQIDAKLDHLFQGKARKPMSITGAANLAGTIRDRIEAAKAKVAQVSANTDTALGKLNDAAETGNKIAKQIEAEADDLLSQIGQFTNGGPE
jgi:hypothetical protein